MKGIMTVETMIADAQTRNAYWEEQAIIEFTAEICRLMKAQDVSRADLARRLNKSQAWVTKLLGGHNNFTLETMVRISRALGGELRVHIQPGEAQTLCDEAAKPAEMSATGKKAWKRHKKKTMPPHR